MKKFFIVLALLFCIGFADEQSIDGNQGMSVQDAPKAPTIAPNPKPDERKIPLDNPSTGNSLTSPKSAKDALSFGIEAAEKGDYKSAFRFFTQACDNGNPAGCFAIGTMYMNGVGIHTNIQKAERYYQMGCSGGDPSACSSLAMIYDRKEQANANDKEKAIQLYMTACQGGDVMACNNLAYMYANGDGVQKDYFKALQYYKFACDAGSDLGCYNLGLLSNTNNVYGYDRAKLTVVDLNYIACNAGDITGCANLGWIYANGLSGAPVSYYYASHYFNIACNSGNLSSCNNLAVLYQKGLGVTQDTQRALDLFGYTCNLGYQRGCDNYRIYKQQLTGNSKKNTGPFFFPNDPKIGKIPNMGKDPRR
ncbi:tetratricopeptide repeat protein [Helicobacter anatolicus]|uniref:tetratricopeptide repeat protein n=1 Tax=Helicobacter anatolicus TaxID=2905874 RepID=UPI002FCE39DE